LQFFYRSVSSRKFDAAWTCLHPNYRLDRWKADPLRFEDGYKEMLSISSMFFRKVNENEADAAYDVYYDEVLFVHKPNSLMSLSGLLIGDARSRFSELLDKFLEDMSQCGSDRSKLERLPLSILFRKDACYAVRWEAAIDGERWSERFANRSDLVCRRALRAYLSKIDTGWKITRFEWLSPF
jgi:hypothetical protein